jgi:hypothetical protein
LAYTFTTATRQPVCLTKYRSKKGVQHLIVIHPITNLLRTMDRWKNSYPSVKKEIFYKKKIDALNKKWRGTINFHGGCFIWEKLFSGTFDWKFLVTTEFFAPWLYSRVLYYNSTNIQGLTFQALKYIISSWIATEDSLNSFDIEFYADFFIQLLISITIVRSSKSSRRRIKSIHFLLLTWSRPSCVYVDNLTSLLHIIQEMYSFPSVINNFPCD